MPAIAHLQKRVDLKEGGLDGTAWAFMICLSIIPVLILAWVTIYLLFLYPYNRTCFCTRQKSKPSKPLDMLQQTNINPDDAWNHSEDKSSQWSASMPRTESGSSTETGSGRLTKPKPATATATPDTRGSVQST